MATPTPVLAPRDRAAIVEARIEAVRSLLAAGPARGVLFSSRRAFAWLTAGGRNHVVAASDRGVVPILVTRDQCFALSPVNEAGRIADEEVLGLPVEVRAIPWEDTDRASSEARQAVGDAADLLDDEAMEPMLLPLRARLEPFEHERMRWLGGVAAEGMGQTLASVQQDTTEDELAGRIATYLAAEGISLPVVLVAADERIERYRHPLPSRATIHRRVMLVIVAERWGLHVAATRFLELEPPSPELVRAFESSRLVIERLRAATRPRATLGAILAAAKDAYREAGLPDEWRLHHQGGLIGYAARERIATPDDRMVVEAGMAVAWNPSVTGAKVEATDLVHQDGLETIAG